MFVRLVCNPRSRRESWVFKVNTSGENRLKDLIPTHMQLEYGSMRVSCLSITQVTQPRLPGKMALPAKMIMLNHEICEFMKFRNFEGKEIVVW